MLASEVIDRYVEDTVSLLPKRLRGDVAAELRSLLSEELAARTAQAGTAPDEASALALVREHGSPNEVAARYSAPWYIVDPSDSTSFLRAGIIGSGALILLSTLANSRSAVPGMAEIFVKLGIPAWLGLLVIWFTVKRWIRMRSKSAAWKPRDRDRVNRLGTALVVPPSCLVVVLYAAPAWMLGLITSGRLNTSWAHYTDEFRRGGLPFFVGLLIALLGVMTWAAVEGRWRKLTRRIDLGLNMALACLTLALAARGNIFPSSGVDQIARDVMAMVAAVYVPSVGVMLFGEIGRVERIAA